MGLSGALGSREDDAGGRVTEGLALAPMGYLGGRALDKLERGAVGTVEHIRDAVRVGGNAELGANMGIRRGLERDGIGVDDLRNAVLPDTGRDQAKYLRVAPSVSSRIYSQRCAAV